MQTLRLKTQKQVRIDPTSKSTEGATGVGITV